MHRLSLFLILVTLPWAQQQTVDLLITGGAVVTMDAEGHLYPDGYVAIRGNRIVALGDAGNLRSAGYRAKRISRMPRLVS